MCMGSGRGASISGDADRRHRIRNSRSPTRNQPQPRIWTPLFFKPKPTDRIGYYCVNPGKPIDMEEFASRLAELYGMRVWVYESLFGCLDVYTENHVSVQEVEDHTMKVLEEMVK